jgi:hypothetical protein
MNRISNRLSNLLLRSLPLTAAMLGASAAHAQHATDMVLGLDAGAITLNAVNPDDNSLIPARVFKASFTDAPNFTNNPGFDTLPGTFPAQTPIGFTIQRALRVWNPDQCNFNDLASLQFRIRYATLPAVFTPLADTPVTGFTVRVNSSGEFHHHYGVTIQAPATPGLYLYEAQLWSTTPGINPSPTYWVVYNQGGVDEATHDRAVRWVLRTLTSSCRADFDLSGFVDSDDFTSFVNAFVIGDCEADVDNSGFVDSDDFSTFVGAFEQGCP